MFICISAIGDGYLISSMKETSFGMTDNAWYNPSTDEENKSKHYGVDDGY
jgi:hypothetical protein